MGCASLSWRGGFHHTQNAEGSKRTTPTVAERCYGWTFTVLGSVVVVASLAHVLVGNTWLGLYGIGVGIIALIFGSALRRLR